MAAGRVRHADMRPSTAQRSAQVKQRPGAAEEERPREHGKRSSGPRQDFGATTRWRKEEKRSKMANWSETMQWKTLDSLASVERPVLHLRREQFASTRQQRHGEVDSNSFSRLLHPVNGAQCRQCLFKVVLAVTMTQGRMCVYCGAGCEPPKGTCEFASLWGNSSGARAALNPALGFDAVECHHCELWLPR